MPGSAYPVVERRMPGLLLLRILCAFLLTTHGPRPACTQTGFPGTLLEKPFSSWALKKVRTKLTGQGWYSISEAHEYTLSQKWCSTVTYLTLFDRIFIYQNTFCGCVAHLLIFCATVLYETSLGNIS